MRSPEGTVLHVSVRSRALDVPRVPARAQVGGDRRGLRGLFVGADAGRLVHGRRYALGEPGDEEPATEHRREGDRRAGGHPPPADNQDDHRGDRKHDRQHLQESEDRLDDRALRGVEADVRVPFAEIECELVAR